VCLKATSIIRAFLNDLIILGYCSGSIFKLNIAKKNKLDLPFLKQAFSDGKSAKVKIFMKSDRFIIL